MVERTSYPIPDGYRMLQPEEIVKEGDLSWVNTLGRFMEITPGESSVGWQAKDLICPIRKDEDYFLKNIERRAA